MIETGFGKEFSEPPSVAVSETRTHCEACKEPLDPNVMHKCHGNQHYEPPQYSFTEITEPCPNCKGTNVFVLTCLWAGSPNTFVTVCKDCRTHAGPEVGTRTQAIHDWNRITASVSASIWPKWMAGFPDDDERANVIKSEAQTVGLPDLTNYKGVCPKCYGEGSHAASWETEDGRESCETCDGKGVIE